MSRRVRDRIERELLEDERAGVRRTSLAIAEATGASESWVKSVRDEWTRGRDSRQQERERAEEFSWVRVLMAHAGRLPSEWRVALLGIGAALNRVSDRSPVGPENSRAFEETLDAIASGVDEGTRDAIVRAVFGALPVAGQPDTSHSQVAGTARERE